MNNFKQHVKKLATLIFSISLVACSTDRYEWQLNGGNGPGYLFEAVSNNCRAKVEREFPGRQLYVSDLAGSKNDRVVTTRLVDGASYREQQWTECLASRGWEYVLLTKKQKTWCPEIDNFCDSPRQNDSAQRPKAELGNSAQRTKAEPGNMAKTWCPEIDSFCEKNTATNIKK